MFFDPSRICTRALTLSGLYKRFNRKTLHKCVYLLMFPLFLPSVERIDQTQEKLVKDLQTVTNPNKQWKMVFNPDITKQAQLR